MEVRRSEILSWGQDWQARDCARVRTAAALKQNAGKATTWVPSLPLQSLAAGQNEWNSSWSQARSVCLHCGQTYAASIEQP